jgi:hypothetical protein
MHEKIAPAGMFSDYVRQNNVTSQPVNKIKG